MQIKVRHLLTAAIAFFLFIRCYPEPESVNPVILLFEINGTQIFVTFNFRNDIAFKA